MSSGGRSTIRPARGDATSTVPATSGSVSRPLTFALAHGVSAGVALKLRSERDIPRVQALLDLSRFATNGMYGSIFVLLGAGVTAAFIAGLWGKGWIWAAIGLLV